MRCEDRQDLIPLYLVDALDTDERDELRKHLDSGCPRCIGSLAEAQAVLAHIPLSLDPIAPPDHVRERLMKRITTPPAPGTQKAKPGITPVTRIDQGAGSEEIPPTYKIGGWVGALAAAVIAGFVTYLAVSIPANQQRDELESVKLQLAQNNEEISGMLARLDEKDALINGMQGQLAQNDSTIEGLQGQLASNDNLIDGMRNQLATNDELIDGMRGQLVSNDELISQMHARLSRKDQVINVMQQRLESIDQTIQVLRSPSLKVVSLTGTDSQPQARARVFWDTNRRRWHFYADGMAQSEAGKTYELWFITADERKIPAGTFDVDQSGRGSLYVDLPRDLDGLALAAVTDEPDGGSQQPTGTIQLVGQIQ